MEQLIHFDHVWKPQEATLHTCFCSTESKAWIPKRWRSSTVPSPSPMTSSSWKKRSRAPTLSWSSWTLSWPFWGITWTPPVTRISAKSSLPCPPHCLHPTTAAFPGLKSCPRPSQSARACRTYRTKIYLGTPHPRSSAPSRRDHPTLSWQVYHASSPFPSSQEQGYPNHGYKH